MRYQTILLAALFLLLTGCYAYGPTHAPYAQSLPAPPGPPPPKVLASPLTKHEYMTKAYQEIRQALPEAEVMLVQDSIKVLFPNHIRYRANELKPAGEYHDPLMRFSKVLDQYRRTDILITGHTDNRGRPERNRELSQRRADHIKHMLVELGVRAGRLETWGLGDALPLTDNETEEGRMANRRVQFVVLYRDR